MRVGVIGAGPTGLVLGTCLARRGHQVTLVDRDPGPAPDGSWPRRGVMQFHHAHVMRTHAVHVVRAELPDAYDAWLALGAEPAYAGEELVAMRSSRETFERALRGVAAAEPGLAIREGHVDGVLVEDGRAAGLVVDGARLEADLVVEAAGRNSRATDALGPRESIGGSCGISYVDRVYRLRPGAELGPMTSPFSYAAAHDGYLVILLLHEHGTFSVIIIRRTSDKELASLRHDHLWDLACAAVPNLAAWADPQVAEPLTRVLVGGNLLNVYRSQRKPDGNPVLAGMVSVGDAVCTTTPNYGRGVALSMLQVARLLGVLDAHGADTDAAVEDFGEWCDAAMRPWVVDHVEIDTALARRWAGEDVFLDSRLPGDLVLAAAQLDPAIRDFAGPWLNMDAGPASLEPARQRARDVYATGWRPSYPEGPTRDELVALLDR